VIVVYRVSHKVHEGVRDLFREILVQFRIFPVHHEIYLFAYVPRITSDHLSQSREYLSYGDHPNFEDLFLKLFEPRFKRLGDLVNIMGKHGLPVHFRQLRADPSYGPFCEGQLAHGMQNPVELFYVDPHRGRRALEVHLGLFLRDGLRGGRKGNPGRDKGIRLERERACDLVVRFGAAEH
jgi:hypothetical protein